MWCHFRLMGSDVVISHTPYYLGYYDRMNLACTLLILYVVVSTSLLYCRISRLVVKYIL